MSDMSEMLYMYLAKRIQEEIPTLCAIEKDDVENIDYILDDIDKFYKDHPKYDEIRKFVVSIYYTGQRISDWDINFFKMEEVVDENGYLVIDEKKREKILLKKMLQASKERIEAVERYKTYKKNKL